MMTSRMVRTRGMEAPYAGDQISAFVLHPIISLAFVVMTALSLEAKAAGIVLAPFLGLNLIVVGLWGYISWADPAGEGGCALRSKGADTPHYCNFCRKTVRGFDHHCSWLNTCISARNYAHFYFLSVCGSLLYLYMSAVGVLTLVWSDEDDQRDAFGSLTASRIAWGVYIAVAGWVAVSFVALAGFHTYLLVIGLGTYDWVVLQNQRRQERLEARRSGGGSGEGCCRGGQRASRRPPIVQDAEGGAPSPAAAAAARGGGQPLAAGGGTNERRGGGNEGVGARVLSDDGVVKVFTGAVGGNGIEDTGTLSSGVARVPLEP